MAKVGFGQIKKIDRHLQNQLYPDKTWIRNHYRNVNGKMVRMKGHYRKSR